MIMKRIGVPTRYLAAAQASTEVLGARVGSEDDVLELPLAKRQRTALYRPIHEEIELAGAPQSVAEIASAVMQAKGNVTPSPFIAGSRANSATADLANGLLALDPELLVRDIEELKRGAPRTTAVPAKRRLDRHSQIDRDGVVGGFRLRSLDQVWPIFVRAIQTRGLDVDLKAAAIAEISSYLGDLRPDPRVYLARQGKPELSDIDDVTEPGSTYAPVRSPVLPADSKSPTKREPQPTSPLMTRRLSDTMVPLWPASTPRAGPSPTKSASPPSTPFVDTPAPRRIVTTSPTLKATGLVGAAQPTPACGETPTKGHDGPKVFRAPSHSEASESDTSSPRVSPSRLSRPVAPTPSRWHREDPSTPQEDVSARRGASLGLVDAILPSTPSLPASTLMAIDVNASEAFHFGQTSSSFNSAAPSCPQAPPSLSRRRSGTTKSGRRKSEPLLRTLRRGRADGQPPLTPQRLPSASDSPGTGAHLSAAPTFEHPTRTFEHAPPTFESPAPRTFEHGLVANTAAGDDQGPQTPGREVATGMPMSAAPTPAISWAQMMGRVPAMPQPTPAPASSVFSVDARQNADIFGRGAPQTSPHEVSAVDQLARIAEEGCGGEARVVVTQENGRLFVRFKLPLKYAAKFPESQGFDESRFTTSPSVISRSPRVTFGRMRTGFMGGASLRAASPARPAAIESPQDYEMTELSGGQALNRTLAVSDFSIYAPHATQADETMSAMSVEYAGVDTMELLQTPTMGEIVHNPGGTSSFMGLDTFPPVDTEMKSRDDTPSAPHDAEPMTRPSLDSPGRDYLRDFIRRSRPKEFSTADPASSSMASPSKRQPLRAKSPNMESPQKGKHTIDDEKLVQDPTPLKKRAGRVMKRRRLVGELQLVADADYDMVGSEERASARHDAAPRLALGVDDDHGDEEMRDAPGTRRSARLRSRATANPLSAPKSSIPTPTAKGGSRSGSGRGARAKASQGDVAHQTRRNTRLNRGNAEYPAEVLARHPPGQGVTGAAEAFGLATATNRPSKRGTNVGWQEPLVAQEADKPRKGRSRAKPTATVGNAGVAKARPPAKRAKEVTGRRAAAVVAAVAAELGLPADEAPTRTSGRVTRSSARLGQQ